MTIDCPIGVDVFVFVVVCVCFWNSCVFGIGVCVLVGGVVGGGNRILSKSKILLVLYSCE